MELFKCDTNSPYVFISYARINREKVRADVSGLQEYGCNAWLDEENMVGGKPVEQTDGIIRNPNCKALIFYMCERSVCSPYCLAELRVAKKYNIPIIPVHCFPVSGLEETIVKLQRHMENNEQVDVSDRLISEILKTKNGSEMISIPYDTPAHVSEIIKSLEGNSAGSVIRVQEPKPEPVIAAVIEPEPVPVLVPEPVEVIEPAPEVAPEPVPIADAETVSAVWNCLSCNANNSTDYDFCLECGGSPVIAEATPTPVPVPAFWNCPQCNFNNNVDYDFCLECGNSPA
jgi:hypothetical protein